VSGFAAGAEELSVLMTVIRVPVWSGLRGRTSYNGSPRWS
jgi:hypothetical protein